MKKAKCILSMLLLLCVFLFPTSPSAFAESTTNPTQPPMLTSISFKNAEIEGNFNPQIYDYTLRLVDSTVTPTLKSYKTNKNADVFVTYKTDETKHTTGIDVTLGYENGSVIYTFNFPFAQTENVNSNNLLSAVDCKYGEVYPEINENDTDYKLYIPSDLTQITLSAATQDVSAYCEVPGTITLNTDQEPTITLIVTASDGSTREYALKVKRLNKTCDEVKYEMAQPGFTSIVEGELYYQKPEFFIAVVSAVAGTAMLIIFIFTTKRLTRKVQDADEEEFFDMK